MFAADRYGHGVDRLFAGGCRDDQFAALRGCPSVNRLLLHGAIRHAARNSTGDLRVAPSNAGQGMGNAIAAHKGHGARRAAKAIVAGDGLLIERSRGGRGAGIPIVGHNQVAQRFDREGLASRAHPGARHIAIDFTNRRRQRRVGAVGIVVPSTRKGGRGHDRRVQVLRLSRHVRQLIAELAVGRVEQHIRRRACAWVVHAENHHRGRIPGRVGRVHFPGRVSHPVVGAPVVGIHPRDLGSGPILNGDRHVGRREFLTELRRERVEFRSEVVRDHAGEFGRFVRRGVDVDLRDRPRLVRQRHFLAVAQVASSSGERRYLLGQRVQADVVGHDTRLAHARPHGLERECGDGLRKRRGP